MTSLTKRRLMVMGHGRHGKDTFCNILQDNHGINFTGSSQVALNVVIWPALAHLYDSKQACFDDRYNWRALWYQLIRRYNSPDPASLCRAVYAESDVYCGIRSKEELYASQKLFDMSVWIDASKRRDPESSDSISVTKDMADVVITNNGSYGDFVNQVKNFYHDYLHE